MDFAKPMASVKTQTKMPAIEYDVYKKIAASLLESASEEELADWNWSPIDKIITMNGDLEQEIVKKVEDTHAGYAEFAELCEELLCLRSR